MLSKNCPKCVLFFVTNIMKDGTKRKVQFQTVIAQNLFEFNRRIDAGIDKEIDGSNYKCAGMKESGGYPGIVSLVNSSRQCLLPSPIVKPFGSHRRHPLEKAETIKLFGD